MAVGADTAGKDAIVAKRRAASNDKAGCDQAIFADDGVVGKMAVIINFGTGANHRIFKCAAVDMYAAAYLHPVLEYDLAKMRFGEVLAVTVSTIAEAICSNRGVGLNPAIVPNLDAVANKDV